MNCQVPYSRSSVLHPDAAKTEGSKDILTSQIINDKLAQALEDNTATKDKLEAIGNGTAMDETMPMV